MKVINIQGRKKTGKTTVATAIIAELVRRGYTVGSVKGIHIEGFSMDRDSADTGKHKAAGASPVTALCHDETNIMFTRRLDLREILNHYDNDWVIIESHADLGCPNIVTGCTAEFEEKADDADAADADDADTDEGGRDVSLAGQINEHTIACSGVVANEITEFRGIPVIDARTEAGRLVDLIEEKTPKAIF